jgi:hypothetical protein
MKRLAVLGSTFLMLFTLAGCGSNQREAVLNEAVGLFETAAANTETVTKEINKAVAEAEKKRTKATKNDFKPAVDAAKKLRETGKQLLGDEQHLGVKGQIDLLQEKTSPEQKVRLAREFEDRLGGLFKRLADDQKKLDEALARAKQHATPEAMTELRKELRASREDMYVLSRPH